MNAISFISLLLFLISGSGNFSDNSLDKNESRKRKEIISTAQDYLGTKYRSGGKSPAGFDCSGFTYFIFKENNIKLGASSRHQALQGEEVKIKNLKPGDLVFFGSDKRINHVGIVVKQSRNELIMVHASSSRGIVEEDVMKSEYWKKRLVYGRTVL